jgi:hypothetical protein
VGPDSDPSLLKWPYINFVGVINVVKNPCH